MVQIKGSAHDSVRTTAFDMKHLKKADVHIGRNVVIIKIMSGSIVKIFKEITNSLLVTFGMMVRVFANGPGDLGSIQGRVIPKT